MIDVVANVMIGVGLLFSGIGARAGFVGFERAERRGQEKQKRVAKRVYRLSIGLLVIETIVVVWRWSL